MKQCPEDCIKLSPLVMLLIKGSDSRGKEIYKVGCYLITVKMSQKQKVYLPTAFYKYPPILQLLNKILDSLPLEEMRVDIRNIIYFEISTNDHIS